MASTKKYFLGEAVEAKDAGGDQWWPAKILELDSDEREVLVHFIKFSARHDEWIRMDSTRLRAGSESTKNLIEKIEKEENNGGSSSTNSKKEFKIGEKVMAPWKYGRKYPALVVKNEADGNYLVEFFDGVRNSVRPATMRYLRKEDEEQVAASNAAAASASNNELNGHDSDESMSRRERKQKFNVKELLNIRINNSTKSKSSEKRRSGRVQEQQNRNGNPQPQPQSQPQQQKKSSKEPLLKEAPLHLVTGKRERKRKKFWDEEEEAASSSGGGVLTPSTSKIVDNKISLSTSNLSSTNSSTTKNRRKSTTTTISTETEIKTTEVNNGKKLEYLLFDMSLDPALIAKQMVEGRNIPGPGVPIPVDSSSLPRGWEKRVIQRGLGVTKGKWDVFIQNPAGKSFRSKTELQRHFTEKKLNYSIDSFDFSLDDNLKRLRQIWKQYVVNSKQQKSISENKTEDVVPGVVSETGQGLRCTINGCGKLFRNDKLLQMHVKHYHPEYKESEESETRKRKLSSSDSSSSEKKLKTLFPTTTTEISSSASTTTPKLPENTSSENNKVPLTFRMSKRRQKQLKKKVHENNSSNDNNKEFMEEFMTFLQSSVNRRSEDGGSSYSYPPSEMDSVGSEHLTNEEVVNCTCGRQEEDGLMIQCDICLCWQHGACLEIDAEDQVPEKHVCKICRDPPSRRSGATFDHDWLKEGKFGLLPLENGIRREEYSERENSFRMLSDLMADLAGLNKVLHSLRVKLHVASQQNNNKVFMWSSPWSSSTGTAAAAAAAAKTNFGCGGGGGGGGGPVIKEEGGGGNINGMIDPSMIPSVSEVEELLPSIIQASLSDYQNNQLIPEPVKRIDRQESRLNLINHIDDVQTEIDNRLSIVEESLVKLEEQNESDSSNFSSIYSKTKVIVQMLFSDISTAKKIINMV